MSKKPTADTGAANVIDIGSYLSRPVTAPTAQSPEFFELEPEPIETAQFDEPEPEPAPAAEPGAPADPFSGMPPKLLAEVLVSSLDSLQILGVGYALERRSFTADERKIVATLSKGAVTDHTLMEKIRKYDAKAELIPFDQGETKALEKSFEAYIKTTSMQVTPLQALMISMTAVVIKRAAIILT